MVSRMMDQCELCGHNKPVGKPCPNKTCSANPDVQRKQRQEDEKRRRQEQQKRNK